MIRPEQIIPLFLEACPGLQPSWTRYVVQTMNSKDPASQQNPMFEVVFPYLLGQVKRHYFKEIPAAFAVIETLLSDGDEETRILVETDMLIPLHMALARSPQTALIVPQWLGARALDVWQVIERFSVEQEQTEQEPTEECAHFTPRYSLEENRQLYTAFGLVGGGPTGLTYMGFEESGPLLSLGCLLLIWIGLSIAERFQRKRLMTTASTQDSSAQSMKTEGPDPFMIKWMWRLLDRAIILLFVLGIPIGLSIVMGHRNFLDSSLLDMLMVGVGGAALIVIMCRNHLWKRFQGQKNNLALRDQPPEDQLHPAVSETAAQADSRQSEFPRKRYAA